VIAVLSVAIMCWSNIWLQVLLGKRSWQRQTCRHIPCHRGRLSLLPSVEWKKMSICFLYLHLPK